MIATKEREYKVLARPRHWRVLPLRSCVARLEQLGDAELPQQAKRALHLVQHATQTAEGNKSAITAAIEQNVRARVQRPPEIVRDLKGVLDAVEAAV